MKFPGCDSDIQIIQYLKRGDPSAIEMLYKTYWKPSYASAYHVLKDRNNCEDIVRDLFINIWRNREQINITFSIQAYLSAATRYEVYRRIRAAQHFDPVVDEMLDILTGFTGENVFKGRQLKEQITFLVDKPPPNAKRRKR